MHCSKCNGLALYERIVDAQEGLMADQYACMNCGKVVLVGPLLPRVMWHERPIEQLGRWAHMTKGDDKNVGET